MNYIYLRSRSDRYSLAQQEKQIKDYMQRHGYEVGGVEIEVSPDSRSLEEREEFRSFLHSLSKGDQIFVYDLRTLSKRIGELIQILNCIYNHGITLVITKYGVKIDRLTPAPVLVSLLHQQREENRQVPIRSGRPRGSISKSKYDRYRERIIQMLKEGSSVSMIAKKLGASRSSVRDYITSRQLREIARGGVEESYPEEIPRTECKINQKG